MSHARRLSFFSQTFPPGIVLDYGLNTAPPGWLLCDGSLLGPETLCQGLRNALVADGFPHGQDGSGNPRIPDSRGRIVAGKDNMGGTSAGRLTSAASGVDGATLGAVGGAEAHTLTTPQMPQHNHGVTDPGHVHSGSTIYNGSSPGGGAQVTGSAYANTGNSKTNIAIQDTGSGQAHNNTQPTLVLNKIIKT